jgi:hypothetical protein
MMEIMKYGPVFTEICEKNTTMKSTLFFSLLLLFGGFVLFQACNTSKKAAVGSAYACPMHPEITGKKGDRCSKCQMALTEVTLEAMGCCPMHKECTGKMGTKCPKCSMPMDQPVEPYVCPMHPDQKGRKGGHCPKCHMDLEPAKPEKGNG